VVTISAYAFSLFNIFAFISLFLWQKTPGGTGRKCNAKVWKPFFVCRVKFNHLYKGTVLISGPALARREMVGAMQ